MKPSTQIFLARKRAAVGARKWCGSDIEVIARADSLHRTVMAVEIKDCTGCRCGRRVPRGHHVQSRDPTVGRTGLPEEFTPQKSFVACGLQEDMTVDAEAGGGSYEGGI